MAYPKLDLPTRKQLYVQRHGCVLLVRLGTGFDGEVWQTNLGFAVKFFERYPGYCMERDVYERLTEHQVTSVAGHEVPQFLGFDNELWAIQMSVVQPPFLLDFAKCTIDFPPDFPQGVMEEARDKWRELFDKDWPAVQNMINILEHKYGIYMLDPNPRNIMFAPDRTDQS
jgi:hypothetical protein